MKTVKKIPKKKAARLRQTAKKNKLQQQYNNTLRHLQESIRCWTAKIPKIYQQNYITAIEGKSRAAAVKAKCLDCCNWQRVEITNCPVETCPISPYRPYRRNEIPKTPKKSETLEKKTLNE